MLACSAHCGNVEGVKADSDVGASWHENNVNVAASDNKTIFFISTKCEKEVFPELLISMSEEGSAINALNDMVIRWNGNIPIVKMAIFMAVVEKETYFFI